MRCIPEFLEYTRNMQEYIGNRFGIHRNTILIEKLNRKIMFIKEL